uniref:Uncharacterized protein n=1 Tax=Arundo donax TaxID=35708 RepID=A0A0A9AIQ9_ARUDO
MHPKCLDHRITKCIHSVQRLICYFSIPQNIYY